MDKEGKTMAPASDGDPVLNAVLTLICSHSTVSRRVRKMPLVIHH